ncbi:MAG TPA: basic amino acid ABC transporter substrate-binding protein [Candidatus Anoxymicrobiaceae bacterium]
MRRVRVPRITIAVLVAVLAGAAVLAGCGNQVASVKTLKPGVLQVGTEFTYPPFEMSVDNTLQGFDVDIANAMAKRLGLKTRFVETRFKSIIPGLVASRYDIVISAMTVTPTRSKVISFSTPYMTADQSVCVPLGSSIKSVADLSGKVVGVETDTTGQLKAEERQKATGIARIKKFDNIQLTFEALEVGAIDALINDYAVNAYMSDQRGHSKVVQKISTSENYGVGVQKGNAQMLHGVNKALASIKVDGTYNAIYKKWFGVPAPK